MRKENGGGVGCSAPSGGGCRSATGEGEVKFVLFTAGKDSAFSLITLQRVHWRELPPLGEALRAVEGVGPYDVDGTFSVPGTPSLSS